MKGIGDKKNKINVLAPNSASKEIGPNQPSLALSTIATNKVVTMSAKWGRR